VDRDSVRGEREGPVRLLINATRSYDFGTYQAYLNGIKIGPVLDFYNKDTQSWEFHLLDFWPDPGTYTLKLVCVGRIFLQPRTGSASSPSACASAGRG